MKNYVSDWCSTIRKTLFQDKLNLALLVFNIVFLIIDCFIWSRRLASADIYIVSLGNIFPIQYLFIILFINLFLAVFSYEKEKEISYLLLGASSFSALLVLILEFYYLTSFYA